MVFLHLIPLATHPSFPLLISLKMVFQSTYVLILTYSHYSRVSFNRSNRPGNPPFIFCLLLQQSAAIWAIVPSIYLPSLYRSIVCAFIYHSAHVPSPRSISDPSTDSNHFPVCICVSVYLQFSVSIKNVLYSRPHSPSPFPPPPPSKHPSLLPVSFILAPRFK